MNKLVEEYTLNTYNLYVLKESLNPLDDNAPSIVIYKLPSEPLAVKKFLDTQNYVNFAQALNNIYKLNPERNSLISIPVIRIRDFNTEYRFVADDKCISFYVARNKYNKPFITTDGIKDYYHGIRIIEEPTKPAEK